MEILDRDKLHGDVDNYVEVLNTKLAVEHFLVGDKTLILSPYQVNSFLKCVEEMKMQVNLTLEFDTNYTPYYLAKPVI